MVPMAVSLVLLTGAAGCSNQLGAAAVIDGHAISTRTIDSGAQAALSDEQSLSVSNPANALALIQVSRTELTEQIQHNLLQRANAASTKPVTDEDVTAFLATVDPAQVATQLQVDPAQLPERVKDLLAMSNLLTEAIAAKTPVAQVSVGISVLTYPSRQAAFDARTGFLARPSTFDEVLADQAAASGQPPATGQTVTMHQVPTAISSGVFTVPVGSLVVITEGESTLLVRVDSRDATTEPIPDALLSQDQQVPPAVTEAFGGLLLATLLDHPQVEVNPRYGTWDPATAQVIPGINAL